MQDILIQFHTNIQLNVNFFFLISLLKIENKKIEDSLKKSFIRNPMYSDYNYQVANDSIDLLK